MGKIRIFGKGGGGNKTTKKKKKIGGPFHKKYLNFRKK
jgi:hypothetical protein